MVLGRARDGWRKVGLGAGSQELSLGLRCLLDVGVEAWLALGFGELSAHGWGWLGTPREGVSLGSLH